MMFADKYKDKYSFIVDPEGSDPNNPGDTCWQTCWLYFAYCVAGRVKGSFWDFICAEYDGDPIGAVERFLDSYYTHCCFHDKMITHPIRLDHFSRDQLSPLLLLISAVKKYQPHLAGKAAKILSHIIMLDNKNAGSLHSKNESKDDLNNANRFIISQLSNALGVNYVPYGEAWLSLTLKAYENMWATHFIWPNKWIPRSYTIWNNVGLLTAVFIHDSKLAKLREYFSWFADHGWGPGYKMVSNKKVCSADISLYYGLKAAQIDIIHQRGNTPKNGVKPTLDYPILLALQKIWG